MTQNKGNTNTNQTSGTQFEAKYPTEIIRKEYLISKAYKKGFNENGESVQNGDSYLLLKHPRGSVATLGSEDIIYLIKDLNKIRESKTKSVIRDTYILSYQHRVRFNEKGIKEKTGSPYVLLKTPANRKMIFDASVLEQLIKDLSQLMKA